MAVYKCKMCGGTLEIFDKSTIVECEYCGTTQTLPKIDDEATAKLFNRANTLRFRCEFDKATELYEKLVNDGIQDCEAYWGLVLCKYGIEYVEDPKTHNRIPTCHRTQIESVLTDVNYQSALQHADVLQRGIYEQEAKAIDKIQKGILTIANNEEPYDVFICYKETDSNGKRTKDSVIANDIYYKLTEQGYKVFYAAITLEDKLGQEYEPYIFAALNSAKVMLVVGTQPEFFSSVWVKNEWSRYLKLMARDRNRLLIPCYRDMDAYDLPDEFAHLQAQDMGKIGFVEDLIRGIRKVIAKSKPKQQTVVAEQTFSNTAVSPLVKRARIFLEDGDFSSANEYAERVLDIDPECAEAYVVKLCCDLHFNSEEQLQNLTQRIDTLPNYVKALKYATGARKMQIDAYAQNVLQQKYSAAVATDDSALLAADAKEYAQAKLLCLKATDMFNEIVDYKDCRDRALDCQCRAVGYDKLMAEQQTENNYQQILANFAKLQTLADYKKTEKTIREFFPNLDYKDVQQLRIVCISKIEELENEERLTVLESLIPKAKTTYEVSRIIGEIKSITRVDTQDVLEKAQKKRAYLNEVNARIELENKKKQRKKTIIVSVCLAAVVVLCILIGVLVPLTSVVDTGGVKYQKSNDHYVAVGLTNNSATEITIKSKIRGVPVKSIGEGAFSHYSRLTNVTIPDCVTSIGYEAFAGCISLKSITIPYQVRFIHSRAFYGCTGLEEINFNATAMEDLLNYNEVFSGAGQSDNGITVNISANVTRMPAYLFYPEPTGNNSAPKITTVIFEQNSICRSIGPSAFRSCVSLTSITIPNSVTAIGSYAFAGCNSLNNVIFTDTTTWYYTYKSSSSAGTQISVINTGENARNLRGGYTYYYWYKE